MPKSINLAGRVFGKLTVVGLQNRQADRTGRRSWECRCECGNSLAATTSRLNSGKLTACPACSGSRPSRMVGRTCRVCHKEFSGAPNAELCSPDCRVARRRGLEAGVEHLPPLEIRCEICGRLFHRDRGLVKTCSKACLKERRKKRRLESWYRRVEKDPEISKKMNRRRRAKAKADPEYEALVKFWDQKKMDRHRQRMASDPEYAATIRARQRAGYARNSEAVLARRKAALDAMSAADLDHWIEKMRGYGRKYRKRWRAELASRPEDHQRFLDLMADYRFRRNQKRLSIELAIVRDELNRRITHEDPRSQGDSTGRWGG